MPPRPPRRPTPAARVRPAAATATRTKAREGDPSLKRPGDLQFLLATAEDLARSLALADVLSAVCRSLLGVVPASRVGILLREGDGALRLAAGAVRGASDADFPRGRL